MTSLIPKLSVLSLAILTSTAHAAAAGQTTLHDYDGDGRADLLWRHADTGQNVLWLSSQSFSQDRYLPSVKGWELLASDDFNADGQSDLLWRNSSSNELAIQWLVKGQVVGEWLFMAPASEWQFTATGDVNADGRADILWRNNKTGENGFYLKTAAGIEIQMLATVADLHWRVAGLADLNADGKDDLIWRNEQTGDNYLWLLNTNRITAETELNPVGLDWQIQAIADQNADNKADILWRNRTTGELYLFVMDGLKLSAVVPSFKVADLNWQIQAVADYNGDGRADQFWQHAITGDTVILLTQAGLLLQELNLTPVKPSTGWRMAPFKAEPLPEVVSYQHGDVVSLSGDFGSNDVKKTFLGGVSGAIEAQAIGATMPNGAGWSFSNLGYPTSVVQDAKRGKVLFTPEDGQHYNAERRYDVGFPIPEQRYFYKAHYVRNVMLVNGQPFTHSYQWKHERINWENSISDGLCEIKIHSWAGADVLSMFNCAQSGEGTTLYGGQSAETNADWALLEILVYTGTQGKTDGKLVTRVFKNGKTYISENQTAVAMYTDPQLRFRYFLEQNYFGNFSQLEAGVDNALPKPDVRQLYSDDSQVIVGQSPNQGWKRVELRDSLDLQQAKVREVQDWDSWNGTISLHLNTGGIASGSHDLYLVVIDGVDADGWDKVVASQAIRVKVP